MRRLPAFAEEMGGEESRPAPYTAAMDDSLPLFRHDPALAARLPRMPLCELPTPVEALPVLAGELGIPVLYAKRDDLSAPLYGGNKVRKLEFLLADALARGHSEVLTFGFAGSNFAAATALYGQRAGLRCLSMLLPQKPSDYVRGNLRLGLSAGASIHHAGSVPSIALRAAWEYLKRPLAGRRPPYWIPAGGSSPPGVAAYINAALELADQVAAGELPAPDRIYVAMGSMGTAAGLAIGLVLADLPTRVLAVRVVEKRFASARGLEELLQRTLRWLGPAYRDVMTPAQALARVDIREEYYGEHYGQVTPATAAALEQFAGATPLRLDGTYSAKAAAALLADARRGELGDRVPLFWHTFNARPLQDLLRSGVARDIPPGLRPYFDG